MLLWGLLGISLISAIVIAWELRNAPEGKEDARGFHLINDSESQREVRPTAIVSAAPPQKLSRTDSLHDEEPAPRAALSA